MRKPRLWKTDTVYELTLRTEHRMFLLKPDIDTKNILGSSLGRALKRHPVRLHAFDSNVNHFHCLFSLSSDQVPNASLFLRYLHGQTAKQLNLHYKQTGRVWSSRGRIIPIADENALISQLLYAATNVVKDGMVAKASQWPGFSTYEQLAHGKRQTFTYLDRTAWWKAGGGWLNIPKTKFMREVSVEVSPLPGWEQLPSHERQSRYRRMVREKEAEIRANREIEGRPVIGKAALMRIDPRSSPGTEKKATPMPKCHASSKESRDSFIKEVLKPFWDKYREASGRFRSGDYGVEFPLGSIPPPIPTVRVAPRL